MSLSCASSSGAIAGRAAAAVLAALLAGAGARGQDVSPTPFLQWFEASWETIENRMPDLFMSGYGAVWLPPPGRADQGNLSVGYDPYDRFDLGGPRNETLYGTETGLKTVAASLHRAGAELHVDAIINHCGFSDLDTPGFLDAGGYPGLALSLAGDIDGDFHSKYAGGDVFGRLAGLIDVAHEKNHVFIRHPVDPGDPQNIPVVGTVPDGAGRLANVPDENNRRFYPDRDLQPMYVYDPMTGEGDIPVYPFNLDDPMAGDPTAENAMGYLMRYLQWMVQEVGVDGYRVDAAKHVEGWVMDYFDRAVYRSNPRPRLDGSTNHAFSYCEVYDGNKGYLQTFVKKTIDPGQPGVIGGNRDVLDFPLHFALRGNLTGDGYQNDWHNVRDAGMDVHDDGLHNGSQGVLFVQSHDEFGPQLSNVAHAYVLMHPGNAVVYFNGKEFGDEREFPKLGRGDAMGGAYGDYVRRLVEVRNTHGRGNYIERWIEKENFAFERASSAIVLLSNRLDAGYDARTLLTTFTPGTPLIELTGAASDPGIDPRGDIPDLLIVNGDNTVNVRFLRNSSYDGDMNAFYHGTGALVYGLSGPEAPDGLELLGTAGVLPGGVPEANDYSNGITRLTDLHVVTGDSFQARLQTVPVTLQGWCRDVWADGDNALIKVDGGVDVDGDGHVEFVTPGTVSYGFECFRDKASPLIGPNGLGDPDWNGDGEFLQTIDASRLAEGVHYIEVRAFRHRDDGGPAIYSSFKKVVYVDRLPPESAVDAFEPFESDPNTLENRDLFVRSIDKTAEAVHVFLDEPASLPDSEFIQRAGAGQNQAGRIDRDLFAYGFFGLTCGNHVATVVTFEPTGNVNVQRFAGLFTETPFGRGLGDVNFDGQYSPADLENVPGAFEEVLWSQDTQFNPAADVTGDGRVNCADLLALVGVLTDGNADAPTMAALERVRLRRADLNTDGHNDGADFDTLRAGFGGDAWMLDLDGDGVVAPADELLLAGGFGLSPDPPTRWQAATGDWADANHWTAGVPTAATAAFVDNGGTAQVAAGTAAANNVYVGVTSAGRVEIGGGALEAGWLHVGPEGALAAAPGGEIRVRGNFDNLSTLPESFDLSSAVVRFNGSATPAAPQLLEAAGADRGADANGWIDNFALGSLVIEPDTCVRLRDTFDNGGDAPGNEAVYVGELVIQPGGWIDLNGLHLYYLNGGAPKQLFYGDADLDGDVDWHDYVALKEHFGAFAGEAAWSDSDMTGDGVVDYWDYAALRDNFGSFTELIAPPAPPVPEPAAAALLALGCLAFGRRRARGQGQPQ